MTIPRKLTAEESEQWRRKVEDVLNELSERAENEFDQLFAAGKRSR